MATKMVQLNFRNSNIDSLRKSKKLLHYLKQNSEQTSVTVNTSACLDHALSSFQLPTFTMRTALGDHDTVLVHIF